MESIALYGATGTLGSRILNEALLRGHPVTVVVRDPSKLASNPAVTVKTGDILDPKSVAEAVRGSDVVISAVGAADPASTGALIRPAAESLVAAARSLGDKAPRIITVGGAGSLKTPDGTQVWDAPGLPDWLLNIMHAHGDAVDYLSTVDDVKWTNVSPAQHIEPGERMGQYRTALNELILGPDGESRISAEDYAVAILDEVEKPQHIGERFTVAY